MTLTVKNKAELLERYSRIHNTFQKQAHSVLLQSSLTCHPVTKENDLQSFKLIQCVSSQSEEHLVIKGFHHTFRLVFIGR